MGDLTLNRNGETAVVKDAQYAWTVRTLKEEALEKFGLKQDLLHQVRLHVHLLGSDDLVELVPDNWFLGFWVDVALLEEITVYVADNKAWKPIRGDLVIQRQGLEDDYDNYICRVLEVRKDGRVRVETLQPVTRLREKIEENARALSRTSSTSTQSSGMFECSNTREREPGAELRLPLDYIQPFDDSFGIL